MSSIFVFPYGKKKEGANEFDRKWDLTDQRAPITTAEDCIQMFSPDDDTMFELEDESIEDFDNDVSEYEYNDRGELGEDITLSQQPEIKKFAPRLKKRTKKV